MLVEEYLLAVCGLSCFHICVCVRAQSQCKLRAMVFFYCVELGFDIRDEMLLFLLSLHVRAEVKADNVDEVVC